MASDERFMRRALQLAANGRGLTSPNPMVGAVIVHGGKIIGEGWHREYGKAHAEVNAVNSVKNRELLKESTMYVTLEPCSHYGKTPPCANLIVECGIPCVVVATADPFEKVSGRGIEILREHGVKVEVGMLEDEARELNRKFFTAHTLGRPYVLLKWAQSSDGFLGSKSVKSFKFSDALGQAEVHELRSCFDAIMVGSQTVIDDNPRLDVRMVDGRSPRAVIADRRGRVPETSAVLGREGTVYVGPERADVSEIVAERELDDVLKALYRLGITSVMVEGGAGLLNDFMSKNRWDDARVEVSPVVLGSGGKNRVALPEGELIAVEASGINKILHFRR